MILSLQEDTTMFEIHSKSLILQYFLQIVVLVFEIQSMSNLIITLFKQNCQIVKISSKNLLSWSSTK